MTEEVVEEKKEEKKSPQSSSCNILHEDCDPMLAKDKKLPYTAYIVEYKKEGRIAHDITMSVKESDLFDMYYDFYKKDFISFRQTEGRIAPNLWNQSKSKKKK
jgi:hypothetical protein